MKAMTTIQMEKPVVKDLEKLKTEFRVSTYNAVVKKLVEQRKQAPKDLFGAFPNLPKFKRDHDDHEY